MKNFIYTTLLVFTTLFCQAFGAQYESPTFYDTICAEPDARNLQMSDLKTLISIFLYDREDSIWLEYGNTVKVELGDITGQVIENNGLHPFDTLSGEKINATKTIQLDVEYTRKLVFSKIPSTENEAQKTSATLALWHIFGKLLSETDTERVTKISDEASVTTLHKAKFVYRFELAFPENEFKIQGDSCFDGIQVILSVDSAYLPYDLKWKAEGVVPDEHTGSPVKFWKISDDDYLYSVSCTAKACKGETRTETFVIGKPTPKPVMEDLACIAANKTSFNVAVKEPDSRLSYHWIFEEEDGNRATQFKQGDLVEFEISPSQSGVLQLYSTGGCKGSDTITQEVYRSVVAGNIQLQGDTNCVFNGDTLKLSLTNAPEDTLVWQIAGNTTMLPPHDTYNYPTVQEKENVIVSVYTKVCPNNIITDTFNIREDFSVSLGTSPMCISANEYQVIKLTSNGVNPEVHWYGNGVEIDSSTYKKEDSIRLTLTNPGDPNLYVKVTAAECGKFSKDSIALRPKPEKPSLDTLWGMLTPCIPLGMADTIELRVQPQEGVKFKWSIPDIITNTDSNSILVKVNYDLSDRNTPIPVSVYAYTDGCPNNSDILQDTLYATGAGLGEEWFLFPYKQPRVFQVGFSQDGQSILKSSNAEFEDCTYQWFLNGVKENGKSMYYTVKNSVSYPFIIACKITNSRTSCYSVYDTIVKEEIKKTNKISESEKSLGTADNKKGQESKNKHIFKPNENQALDVVLKPNPVRSGVQVKVEGICETESFTVECYSPQGKCMFRTTAKGDTFTLPTDNYAAGVYIVKIQLDGAAAPVVKKMIIL